MKKGKDVDRTTTERDIASGTSGIDVVVVELAVPEKDRAVLIALRDHLLVRNKNCSS